MSPDLSQISRHVAFIIEIDKLKGVLRKNKPVTLERPENSAEHSWQIAMLALTMHRYADEIVDIDHVVRLLLVHDIGEIDVGDTILYAEGALAADKAAEQAAVERIADLLPQDTAAEIVQLWIEFEQNHTPESRFANAMDRLMPVLLNLHRNGQSWRENGVKKEQVLQRAVSKIRLGSQALADWATAQIEEGAKHGFFAEQDLPVLQVAALVCVLEGKLLLVRVRNQALWYLPGGKIEQGESATAALSREIREELGLHIPEHDFVKLGEVTGPAYGQAGEVCLHCFSAVLPAKPKPAAEISALSWLHIDDAREQMAPAVQKMLDVMPEWLSGSSHL